MKKVFPLSLLAIIFFLLTIDSNAQDFQGKAYYISKTTMDMSRWERGRQLSEQQKKQIMDRMRSWLERSYVLTFNKEESIFVEEEKLEAPGSRGPSMWGSSFSPGPQYKNVQSRQYIQDQEFFGKKFLIKEDMEPLEWEIGTETKQIGQYLCIKATATRPSTEFNWTRARDRRNSEDAKKDSTKTDSPDNKDQAKTANDDEDKEEEVEMVDVVAWYTPMIPINQGPADYWGLPGLILEVSAGNTTMLCSKIVMNPSEKVEIKAPSKGEEVTKEEYNKIISDKIQEMRDNRGRNRGRRF